MYRTSKINLIQNKVNLQNMKVLKQKKYQNMNVSSATSMKNVCLDRNANKRIKQMIESLRERRQKMDMETNCQILRNEQTEHTLQRLSEKCMTAQYQTNPRRVNFVIEQSFVSSRESYGQISNFFEGYLKQIKHILIQSIKLNCIDPQQKFNEEQTAQMARKELKLNLRYASTQRSSISQELLLPQSDSDKTVKQKNQTNQHKCQIINVVIIPACYPQKIPTPFHHYQSEQNNFEKAQYLATNKAIRFNEQLKKLASPDNPPYIILVHTAQSILNHTKKYQMYEAILNSYAQTKPSLESLHLVLVNRLADILSENLISSQNGFSNFYKLKSVQQIIFKAQTAIRNLHSLQILRQNLFQSFIKTVYIRKSLSQLIKFMTFYKEKSRALIKRYYNLWVLLTAESNLGKMDRQIVQKKYCQQKYRNSLKRKAFDHWKHYLLLQKIKYRS